MSRAASGSPPGSTRRSRARSPRAAQELGYTSMWSNDHPGAKGLETLAAFAEGADRLELGVAVIALDRHQPAEIAAEIERLGLDRERLWLGVGAGFSEKPLTTMREALPELREALPGVRLVLAAMGPKMCALAGAAYDGVFFNWMTPEFAAAAREQRRGRRRARPAASRRRSSATCAPRSAPTPRSGSPRRSPSTATSTTATATTSTGSASPRARSASPPRPRRRQAELAATRRSTSSSSGPRQRHARGDERARRGGRAVRRLARPRRSSSPRRRSRPPRRRRSCRARLDPSSRIRCFSAR